jgi:hypothetical protein
MFSQMAPVDAHGTNVVLENEYRACDKFDFVDKMTFFNAFVSICVGRHVRFKRAGGFCELYDVKVLDRFSSLMLSEIL